MLFKLGETKYVHFTTHNPSTGEVSDADSTPTAQVFEDNTGTAIYSPSVAKVGSETGVYVVTLVLTSGNGFELDKSYNVIASATVNSVHAKARVAHITLDKFHRRDLAEAEYQVTRARRGSKEEIWTRTKP